LDGDPLLDGHAGDDVLLQNALEAPRGHVVIPDPFGVDDEPRTVRANAEARCLRSHDLYVRFFHALFDEFPQLLAIAGLTAVGSEADEQMFARPFYSGFAQTFLEISFAHLFPLNCRSLQITDKTIARHGDPAAAGPWLQELGALKLFVLPNDLFECTRFMC
jgi:hypothetical protein